MRFLQNYDYRLKVTEEVIYSHMLGIMDWIDDDCFYYGSKGPWPYRTLSDEGILRKDKAYYDSLELIKKYAVKGKD